MKALLPLAALGLVLTAAVPATAASQVSVGVGIKTDVVQTASYNDRRGHRWLDRRDIERRLYRAGYVRVYNLDRYGDRYRARAVNRRGVVFALTVNGYNGAILRADIVGRERNRRW